MKLLINKNVHINTKRKYNKKIKISKKKYPFKIFYVNKTFFEISLDIALNMENYKISELLLENGANSQADKIYPLRTNDKYSSSKFLLKCISFGYKNMVKLLLNYNHNNNNNQFNNLLKEKKSMYYYDDYKIELLLKEKPR